ncbi:MAG: thioesterase family protein [Myxococcales bacterium]|nr:thioesterase family protein [Myxococcales bacterium]
MAVIETLRSGVNSWECDQMGHLNVRTYFARANQGMVGLALALGLGPGRMRAQGWCLRASDQHVRFMRELRVGASYTVRSGIVAANSEGLEVYQELRFAGEQTLAASVFTKLGLRECATDQPVRVPEEALSRVTEVETALPDDGFGRGIERSAPQPGPSRDEAIAMGMVGAYMAPVSPEDCDAHGLMTETAFMARVSDGIGHFFRRLHPPGTPVGGAALEYRYVFHTRPRLGDLIEVRTGLKALGNKTRHFCHFVFDVESGCCVASSEAVAVGFDLKARRALPISPEARAHMQAQIVPGLRI